MDAGYHSVDWNADAYSSGMYIVRMHAYSTNDNGANESVKTQKMLLLR